MNIKFSPVVWKAGAVLFVVAVLAVLIKARSNYLEEMLSDEEMIEVTGPENLFVEKTFGHLAIRLLPKDSFVMAKIPFQEGGPKVENWQMANKDKEIYLQFCQLDLRETDPYDIEKDMLKVIGELWNADKQVKELNRRFYKKNGKTMLEADYIFGLFERRVLACSERKPTRAFLVISMAPPYAKDVQDSMLNSIEFR